MVGPELINRLKQKENIELSMVNCELININADTIAFLESQSLPLKGMAVKVQDPKGGKHTSPGQRPGNNLERNISPERASYKKQTVCNALSGLIST